MGEQLVPFYSVNGESAEIDEDVSTSAVLTVFTGEVCIDTKELMLYIDFINCSKIRFC